MKFGLSILESAGKVASQVLKSISKEVGAILNKAQPKIQKDLRTKLAASIRSQPEYGSLKGGELRYNFGLSDVAAVDILVDRFVESIYVTTQSVEASANKISAQLIFSILAQNDLEDILSSSEANQLTEKGESLPWLSWLLLRGNEPIIMEHRIVFKQTPFSRTGQAIMVPSKSGNWRVPPTYIGTIEDNWITRALSSIEDEIPNILSRHIK
jgi:hypothetical protein|tara:strand:+ start:390 stop:1025 length:636 start_codon:yes stop_codon:yes gene_type:complete